MVEVVFHRDSRGRLSSFFAGGHAEFADKGEDVVCAAVSAILQAARLGLEEYAGVALEAHQQHGSLSVAWPPECRDDERVRAIAATAELSIRRIAEQFPEHVGCTSHDESAARRNTPGEAG